jgi:hypothetical protein
VFGHFELIDEDKDHHTLPCDPFECLRDDPEKDRPYRLA